MNAVAAQSIGLFLASAATPYLFLFIYFFIFVIIIIFFRGGGTVPDTR